MDFQKGDIVTKSKTHWLSERIVSDNCNLSESYLQNIRFKYKNSVQPCHRHHNILPATGKSWRWAKIKGEFYYDIEYIPNRKPTYFRNLFGNIKTLVKNYQEFLKNTEMSFFEMEFKNYIKDIAPNYKHVYRKETVEQRDGLALACAILEFALYYCEENPEDRKNNVYKDICKLIKKHSYCYIPSHFKRFGEKAKMVINGEAAIAEVIQLPRANNSNASKNIDKEIISWALQMRSMPQNYSNAHIVRKIHKMCDMTGKYKPSLRWFGQKIFEKKKTKFLTAASRFGSGEARANMHKSYTPMKNALFAGDCWQIDATRVNMIAHKTQGGDKKFLFIIAVRDVHSGDVLGYHFDYSENRWSVHNALKMAVEQTGYLPYELVTDRFPGHNTQEWKRTFKTLEQMGTKITVSHDPQAKAKLERWFETLQSVFMMDSDYYYGEGIKSSRPSNHRSPDYLKEIQKKANKQGWDLNANYAEAANIVEAYRSTVLSEYSRKFANIDSSPAELHQKSEKPHVKRLKDHQISMIFGLKKGLNKGGIKVTNSGQIQVDIQKITRYFRIEDYDLYTTTERVIMSYDLNDLSKVYLFEKNGDLLIHLGEAHEFEPVQPYGPQAEYDRIAKEKSRKKVIEEQREKELEEAIEGENDVALLMGRLTNKEEAENAETTILLNRSQNYTLKKVANSDSSEDDDFDNVLNTRNQY